MPTVTLLLAIGICLALMAVALLLGLNGRPGRHAAGRPSRQDFRPADAPAPPRRRAAVIVNPTKFPDLEEVRRTVNAVADALDWDPPLVLATSKEDPGTSQTRQAIEAKVDLVCPLGGDGTVRTVAAVLAGTTIPLGLLPGGTGNLLARNLDLPTTDLAEAFRMACTGRNKAIDVGWLTLALSPEPAAPSPDADDTRPGATGGDDTRRDDTGSDDTRHDDAGPGDAARMAGPGGDEGRGDSGSDAGPDDGARSAPGEQRHALPDAPGRAGGRDARGGEAGEHAFLVMAGVGLDAAIMSGTTEQAKARMGWTAYVATGFRKFLGERLRAQVAVDDAPPVKVHARTVLIGNCGRITGGINLMPEAQVDDGVLDVVVLAPRSFAGWVDVTARVLSRRGDDHTRRLHRHRGTVVVITTEVPQDVQLDGDVIGEATRVRARIAPRSLLVRTPAGAPAA